MDNRPIGVFDSGLGGLTALKELKKILPNENYVYFGDTGRVPYGPKSRETIVKYTIQGIRLLEQYDVKLIAVACGTMSSALGEELSLYANVPCVDVISPSIGGIVRATQNDKVGVIATAATIRSGRWERSIKSRQNNIAVFSKACPLLVPLVEDGWIERDNPVTKAVLRKYLGFFDGLDIDTLVLGCTHYPILAGIIADIMGDHVALIDSGKECAHHVKKMLTEGKLLSDRTRPGECRYFVSDSTENFSALASVFLEEPTGGQVTHVDIEKVV